MTAPTLTEFLLARIAEDEVDAQQAAQGDPDWRYADHHSAMRIESSDGTNITHDSEGLSDSIQEFAGPHVARHDPARVLAECEAKRRIVEHCADDLTNKHRDVYVLEFLALPYADHPDYDETWRA